MKKALLILALLLLSGCSEVQTPPSANTIELNNEAAEAKNAEKCQFESDVIAAQSNWATNDYTETEDFISPECKE